jgi:hypothetical protein
MFRVSVNRGMLFAPLLAALSVIHACFESSPEPRCYFIEI